METKEIMAQEAKETRSSVSRKIGSAIIKTGKFINKHSGAIVCCLAACLLVGKIAFAGNQTDADNMWDTMTSLIAKWVMRLGGVVIFVGGIMFGLGWKDDNADGKSRGVNTMIAGAIVMAMAGLATIFFDPEANGTGNTNNNTGKANTMKIRPSFASVQMVDDDLNNI